MKKLTPLFVALFFCTQCEKDLMPEFSSLTDQRDGNVYMTVTIGDQTWLAENLRYLPEVYVQGDKSTTSPRYYVIGYDGVDVEEAKTNQGYTTYGVYYNYPAALDACPSGWHIPGEEEWEELNKFVGRWNGEALRSEELWVSSMQGDNSSGFNLLPSPEGDGVAVWGTGQPTDVPGRIYVWGFFSFSNERFVHDDTTPDEVAFVRCIKD